MYSKEDKLDDSFILAAALHTRNLGIRCQVKLLHCAHAGTCLQVWNACACLLWIRRRLRSANLAPGRSVKRSGFFPSVDLGIAGGLLQVAHASCVMINIPCRTPHSNSANPFTLSCASLSLLRTVDVQSCILSNMQHSLERPMHMQHS